MPTVGCDSMCDYDLWGLEAQVDEIINRIESDVNTTVSEIALEMEIIVLQNFEAASKALDSAVEEMLEPTGEILGEYEALLAELLPDVTQHLAAGRETPVQALPRMATTATPEPPRSTLEAQPTTMNLASTPQAEEAKRSVGTSPLTATLVVLGALFAGVAVAAQNAEARNRRYEELL